MHPDDSRNPTARDDGSLPSDLLLDRLFADGFDPASLPERLEGLSDADRRRATRLSALLARLDDYPEETASSPDSAGVDADTLVAATLARVALADTAREERMRIDPERVAPRRFRMPDLVAVASVAILAISVLVPLLNWARGNALEARCANNLRLVSAGIAQYVGDHRAMPMAASIVPSQLTDWTTLRHSDNLKTLAQGHYCGVACLNCPGDTGGGCYAYRVPTDRVDRVQPDLRPRAIVVADRNPLVELRRRGDLIARVTLNSACHEGRGQNVLRADGTVAFLAAPFVEVDAAVSQRADRDNIWLPFGNAADALDGPPSRVVDTFLLH